MDQSHRIRQSNGSAAHVARLVEPSDWGGSIAGLPFPNRPPSASLGCFRCFLQRNISQTNNCRIGNERVIGARDSMPRILAEGRAGPSKNNVVTCSTCLISSGSDL